MYAVGRCRSVYCVPDRIVGESGLWDVSSPDRPYLPFLNMVLWRYRYRLYRTDQHRTGTDNYRYSNGQRFRVYWLYWWHMQVYIQDRWIVSAGRLTAHVTGMLVDWPGTPCVGGRGEVKVESMGLAVSGLRVGRLLQNDTLSFSKTASFGSIT